MIVDFWDGCTRKVTPREVTRMTKRQTKGDSGYSGRISDVGPLWTLVGSEKESKEYTFYLSCFHGQTVQI